MTSSFTILNGSIRSTPCARNQSQTRVTSFSGADAPDVTPTVVTPSSHASSISVSSSIRCDATPPARATSTRRFEFDELREPITSSRSTSASSLLDRPLPVGGRVTDVLLLRRIDLGKAPAEDADDVEGLVDRQRRLRDVGNPCVRRELERLGLGHVLHEHRRLGRLAHRSDDLLVACVSDQDHGVAVGGVPPGLDVHLGHERAGRVDHVVSELGRGGVHGRCDTVCRVDDRRALGCLILGVDEDRAAHLEIADDVDVVDDLLADVHRRAVMLEGELDRLDGALDPGAVAAWRREEDTFDHAEDRSFVRWARDPGVRKRVLSRRGVAATGPISNAFRASTDRIAQ